MENKLTSSFYFKAFIKSIRLASLIFLLGFVTKCILYIPAAKKIIKHRDIILNNLGDFLILFSLVLFIFMFVRLLFSHYKKYLKTKKAKIVVHIISICENAFNVIFIFTVINIFLSSLNLPNYYVAISNNIIIVLSIAAIAWTLLEILSMVEDIVHLQYSLPEYNNRKTVGLYTKVHIIRNIAASLIITLAFASSLMIFDKVRDIGVSILASAGFLTAMVALAAQKSLASILAGIQIAFSQSIKIDDYITIENQTGTVEEITLSYVRLRLSDNRRLILPIQFFLEKSFQNWSNDLQSVFGVIKLYVNYNAPIEKIRNKLFAVIESFTQWDKQKVSLSVSELKENNIELRITVSAANPSDLDNLSQQIKESLLDYLCTHYPNSLPVIRIESFAQEKQATL